MSSVVEGHQGALEGVDPTLADVAGTTPTDGGTNEDVSVDATDKDKLDNHVVAANPQGKLKEPACQIFYAVRKCDSLKAPAIFFSFDDANFFVEMENEKVECKEFNVILDAMEYLYQNAGVSSPGKDFTVSAEAADQEATTGADDIMVTDNAEDEPSRLDAAGEINESTGANESTAAPETIPTGLNWTQPVPIIPLVQQPTESARPTSPSLQELAKTARSRQSAQRTKTKTTNAPSSSASASSPSTKKRARSRTAPEEESPTKKTRKKETKIVRMFDEKFELLKQYKEQVSKLNYWSCLFLFVFSCCVHTYDFVSSLLRVKLFHSMVLAMCHSTTRTQLVASTRVSFSSMLDSTLLLELRVLHSNYISSFCILAASMLLLRLGQMGTIHEGQNQVRFG